MKLVTSYEYPPIPWRKFDWVAFDEDQMSGICTDPDCNCRHNLVRGWGETEEIAIQNFVSDLLERCGIEMRPDETEYAPDGSPAHGPYPGQQVPPLNYAGEPMPHPSDCVCSDCCRMEESYHDSRANTR